jgi:hypothetical protein
MKRHFAGLQETGSSNEIPDGIFLVRVQKAEYHWHAKKPFYTLRLSVLEPKDMAGRIIFARLYCTCKALWKLGWFLRDFLYDPDLLGAEEIDDKALFGLRGVVKISHTTLNGRLLLNLDGFAPASQWQELSAASASKGASRRSPNDL